MNENDKILESIIYTMDEVDTVEIGITLNVKGIVISGMLISKSTYLKGIASSFEGKGEIGSAFSDMFSKLAERPKDLAKEEDTELNDDKDKSVYSIHLKNAQIFDGEFQHDIGYWRGKLSSVDGFTFGKM